MSQRQCYECKGYGHLSYDCPNKRNGERRDGEGSQRSEGGYRPERSRRSNSPVPTPGTRDGTWPTGGPRIWCPYHDKEGRWVGHEPHECRNAPRSSAGSTGRSPAQHNAPSASNINVQVELRDLLASIFPEKAEALQKQNTANGISLVFNRDVTDSDEKWVTTNIPEAMKIYRQNSRALVFGTASPAAQQAVAKRLGGLKDGKSKVIVTAINAQPVAEPEGLHIADDPEEPIGLNLTAPTTPAKPQTATAPKTPDAMVLDAAPTDDPYEARFQKIEGDVQGIRTDITSINTRMGTMTGDIINALRADRAAEQSAEASSGSTPSTGTQPAFGTTTTPTASPSYIFMRRPKDIPFDMGPAPVDAWVVVKEGDDGRQRRAVKVMIPALPTDKSAQSKATPRVIPYGADGQLCFDSHTTCPFDSFMDEVAALNLATAS